MTDENVLRNFIYFIIMIALISIAYVLLDASTRDFIINNLQTTLLLTLGIIMAIFVTIGKMSTAEQIQKIRERNKP